MPLLMQVADEAQNMLVNVDAAAAQANDLTTLFSHSPRFPEVTDCTQAVKEAEVCSRPAQSTTLASH